MGMDVITNLKVDEVLKQIGIDNPTVADRTTIMNFLKQQSDFLGVANPTTADRTTIMNYNKLLESMTKSRYSEVFSASGSWTCPTGVTNVFVTACAGGGAGTGYDGSSNQYVGGSGGVTSFGGLLSLSGGTGGGTSNVVGIGGGHISGNGGVNGVITGSYGGGAPSGSGGTSIFGTGPCGTKGYNPTVNNMKGSGGAGYGFSTSGNGNGGGAGAGVVKYPLTVVPGTTYTITIGAGGVSPGTTPGTPGGAGYMIIEYNM